MSFAAAILRALLRRTQGGGHIGADLVLVHDHPVLASAPAIVAVHSGQWRFTRVKGELALRAALPRGGDGGDRLIAGVAEGFVLPRDVSERCWKRQALQIRADDVVSAACGRPCMRLQDPSLIDGVFEHAEALADLAPGWTLASLVSEADVRAMVAAATLGLREDLGRTNPAALLARWIRAGGPPRETPALLQTLDEALGPPGRWLADAVRAGSVKGLVAAGALAPTATGRGRVQGIRIDGAAQWRSLAELVGDALALARVEDEAAACEATSDADAIYAALGAPEPERHPLLQGALDAGLAMIAAGLEAGAPPDDDWITLLGQNLYFASAPGAVDTLRDVARLSRFVAAETPTPTGQGWLTLARGHTAWADLLLRRVRRGEGTLPPATWSAGRRVLDATLAKRDALNHAFATFLTTGLMPLQASADYSEGFLPLHRVSSHLVGPLLADGQRVFLIVLDGCDLSTFYALLNALPEGLGLTTPKVTDGDLRDTLAGAHQALRLGVAPLPTVTAVGRRALFAGEIPGHPSLSQAEAEAANASGDKAAFTKNKALKQRPRRLFLKGDLADDGAALRRALKSGQEQLVAVVLNGIDDALSSKQTTPLGPWTWEALGARADETLKVAVDEGWAVLITSDHGHTPYLSVDRKAAPKGTGQRFHSSQTPGATRLDAPAVPSGPLYFLSQVGAWIGTQRRGFHGGASLEEVVVPLAFIGEGGQQPKRPEWWDGLSEGEDLVEGKARREGSGPVEAPGRADAKHRPAPTASEPVSQAAMVGEAAIATESAAVSTGSTGAAPPPPQPPSPAKAQLPPWASQITREKDRRALLHLATHGSITEAELNTLMGKPRLARAFANRIEAYLPLLPFAVRVEQAESGKRYVRVG